MTFADANESWQPTPGFRLAAFPLPLTRSGCTLRWATCQAMKGLIIFLLSCTSLIGAENDVRVFTTSTTNAENGLVYTKDVFTRNGQTNLVRVTKIVAGKISRIYRFWHAGQVVGNYLAFPEGGAFNTESGPYCMSLKFEPSGEILSVRLGDKDGLLLDEFRCTNGVISPIDGPLRKVGLMKPKFAEDQEPQQVEAPNERQ